MADEGAFGQLYLVKQSEKHVGPHAPWFWDIDQSGARSCRPEGPRCGCGGTGCAEAICSAVALARATGLPLRTIVERVTIVPISVSATVPVVGAALLAT